MSNAFDFDVKIVAVSPMELEVVDNIKNKLFESAFKAIPSIVQHALKKSEEEAMALCEIWIKTYDDRNDHSVELMVKPGTEDEHRTPAYKKEITELKEKHKQAQAEKAATQATTH